jgi:hypothetical protein
VLPATGSLPGLGLVGVEGADSVSLESLKQSSRQVIGQRRRASLAGRLGPEVRKLLSLEQIVPDSGFDSHTADGSLGIPGCLVYEAENTPAEPDPVSTGEGSPWQYRVV